MGWTIRHKQIFSICIYSRYLIVQLSVQEWVFQKCIGEHLDWIMYTHSYQCPMWPKGFSSLLIVLRRTEHSTLTNVLFNRKKDNEIYCHFLWLWQQKKEMKAIRENKYEVWILLRHNLIIQVFPLFYILLYIWPTKKNNIFHSIIREMVDWPSKYNQNTRMLVSPG